MKHPVDAGDLHRDSTTVSSAAAEPVQILSMTAGGREFTFQPPLEVHPSAVGQRYSIEFDARTGLAKALPLIVKPAQAAEGTPAAQS